MIDIKNINIDDVNMYASTDAHKFGIFEGKSDHLLLFEYKPEERIVEVTIRSGWNVEGTYRIKVDSNVMGRKYDEIISVIHYFERILVMADAGKK